MIRTSFRDGTVEACSSFLDYLRSQIVQFLMKNVLNKSLLIILNLADYSKQYSSFSRDVTTNYAMARAPEVGHAGGHSAGRVVSKQRPLGQLLRALCFKYRINGLYLCCKELWTQYC